MKKALFSLLEYLTRQAMMFMGSESRRVFCTRLASLDNLTKVVPSGLGALRFHCPNDLTAWRADTLLTKEPETIDWIDAMPQDAVLWDIGANVGCYTIYAAKRGLRVLAFEPSHTNYGILNANIALNGLDKRATAYCLAVSEKTELGLLDLSSLEPGGALSDFHGDKKNKYVTQFHNATVMFAQGMMGASIDALVEMPGAVFPDFIKIDVDGIELQIIKGAHRTLRDPRLQGLMVEVEEDDADNAKAIVSHIEEAGMVLEGRRHGPMLDDGPFSNIYNYFFIRKAT